MERSAVLALLSWSNPFFFLSNLAIGVEFKWLMVTGQLSLSLRTHKKTNDLVMYNRKLLYKQILCFYSNYHLC